MGLLPVSGIAGSSRMLCTPVSGVGVLVFNVTKLPSCFQSDSARFFLPSALRIPLEPGLLCPWISSEFFICTNPVGINGIFLGICFQWLFIALSVTCISFMKYCSGHSIILLLLGYLLYLTDLLKLFVYSKN